MKRIKRFRDNVGKYRWVYWISSDIVGASTQGYSTKADRNANLEEVMGGRLESRGSATSLRRLLVDGLHDSEAIPVDSTWDTRPEDDETAADLPLHRTWAGTPGRCSTCDGGGCPDCTDATDG